MREAPYERLHASFHVTRGMLMLPLAASLWLLIPSEYHCADSPEQLCPEYELLRVPAELWPALEACLQVQGNFVVAWMQAISASFPGRDLMDLLREGNPRLFPPFLRTRERDDRIQVCVVHMCPQRRASHFTDVLFRGFVK